MTADELRQRILSLVEEYATAQWPETQFVPGESPVPVSGKVFDADEIRHLVDASLDFWLTTGRFAHEFERSLADWLGVRHAILVNSGSSANLLALTALTSETLGNRRLKPGDEVITCAAGFPTTVNPIIQNGLVPVFLDVTIPTYNMDVSRLEEAVGERTRAIMVAHTLGNPFDVDAVLEVAKRHELWIIEDTCDALGATWRARKVGTFGDLATISFYPAHHITLGEGGAVLTSDPTLKRIVESLRDWGRDCWCDTGVANTCKKRFGWQLGELPYGYDHKYIYSHIGYNMKATDMQAAIGVAQLKKLPRFIEHRRANFARLRQCLEPLQEQLILPEATPGSEPSWFGLPLTLREPSSVSRHALIEFLDSRRIGTRLLFGGNLLRQPAYRAISHRQIGALQEADRVMRQTFWVGVFPGLTAQMLDFIVASIQEGLEETQARRAFRGEAP